MQLPTYPVYVISKGRFNNCLTAKFLAAEGVPFRLVVEPQEIAEYSSRFGKERVLELPFSNLGLGGIPARNWVWEHAKASGATRHWILDDNIKGVRRWYDGKRIACASGVALKATEDFIERYENIAVSGLNYTTFAHQNGRQPKDPFWLNCHVYSCLLILNELPHRWRGRYNEDTDLCLQVLADGWCTVLMNAFMVDKVATMTMKGGNSAELYKGDGRLKMARSLERLWPHVVKTGRRWKRPQHVVKNSWKLFDTPLKKKQGLSLDATATNDYGMKLVAKKAVKSAELRKLLEKT